MCRSLNLTCLRGPKKTKDIARHLSVTLEELYNGSVRKMKLTKNVSCKECNGNKAKTFITDAYSATGSTDGKSYVCKDCDGAGQVEVVRSIGFGMIR